MARLVGRGSRTIGGPVRLRLVASVLAGEEAAALRAAKPIVARYRSASAQKQSTTVEVVLHLIAPAGAAGRDCVTVLRESMFSSLGPNAWIDVISLKSDGSDRVRVGQELGDVADRLLRSQGDDLVVVLAQEGLGTSEMRGCLRELARLFDVAVQVDDAIDGPPMPHPPTGISLPRVQREFALRFEPLLGGVRSSKEKSSTGGPSETSENAGFQRERVLHSLADPWAPSSPSLVSSCVLLLQNYADGVRFANSLKALIATWEQERIWDMSYVNEMVLHDESHSMSVDRNVALLAAQLLESGALNPYDVYVLALTAWLHDWGHASCGVNNRFPTDPVEVRDYHGPLTALRLREHVPQHGITDTDVLNEVRLISAHHQGWTSCDHQEPNWRKPRQLGVITPDGKGVGLLEGQLIGSFDQEAAALFRTGTDVGRLRKLLALFRVADACDIGRHRVPHAFSRHHAHNDLLVAFLERGFSLLEPKYHGWLVEIEKEYQGLLSDVADFRTNLPGGRSTVLEAEVKALAARRRERLDPALQAVPDTPSARAERAQADELARKFGVDAWQFAAHLASQEAYFAEHGQIRGVYPTLTPSGGKEAPLMIELHVFRDEAHKDAVKKTVEDVVLREFGYEDGAAKDSRKSSIGDKFQEMGVVPNFVEVQGYRGVIT